MEKKTIKIVIAGHVDHGKSTLIGRLILDTNSLPKGKTEEIKNISRQLGKDAELAFLTDQLREEREKNMTIDTAQVFFKTRKNNYVIIDTPGHAEFIKNMLTGSSAADIAVLVVDVQAGAMEQTYRHAYLISMLGIDKIIVLLNKMDLAGYKEEVFNKVKAQLLEFLQKLGLNPFFTAPVSAKCGDNIARKSSRASWYKGKTLLEALDSLRPDANETKDELLRFPVQDIYNIEGKCIIAGRVACGIMKRGQKVILLPSREETTINTIRVFGENGRTKALTGENIGITLDKPLPIRRGNIFVSKECPLTSALYFKGEFFWLSEEPLQLNGRITLRCATQEVQAIVEKIEKRIDSTNLQIIEEDALKIELNDIGVAIFKAEQPITIEKFSYVRELGRFVIERDSTVEGVGICV